MITAKQVILNKVLFPPMLGPVNNTTFVLCLLSFISSLYCTSPSTISLGTKFTPVLQTQGCLNYWISKKTFPPKGVISGLTISDSFKDKYANDIKQSISAIQDIKESHIL